jgi:GNAT superfamily N-acetyltransferase
VVKRPRVTLRSARLSDAPAIARVMRAAIRRLARGTVSPRQLSAWSSLPALYHAWAMTAGGEEFLVAEERARVVAYVARRGREITAVFVLPSHARRGLGARLLAAMERRAARSGVRSAFVRAAPGAVPFYEAMGYRGGRAVRVPLPGGVHLGARRMTKRLPAPSRRVT